MRSVQLLVERAWVCHHDGGGSSGRDIADRALPGVRDDDVGVVEGVPELGVVHAVSGVG
jgi:hypothetical protein